MNIPKIIEDALKIVEKKNLDYNTNVSLDQYFPFGVKSYVQMIHIKSTRLVSLANKQDFNDAEFESAKDTLLDLINYIVMFDDYLTKQEFKKLYEPDNSTN